MRRVGELGGDLGSINKSVCLARPLQTALALDEFRRGVREAEEIEHLVENGRGGGPQVLVADFEIAPLERGSLASSFVVSEPELGSAGRVERSPCLPPTVGSVA
jgi:hypothetical protein